MGGQTVYQDQLQGFPGMRQGWNHKAKSLVNDTGAVRQVHDLTVSAAVNATAYQFEIDGVAIGVTSPAAGSTLTSIRDQLLAAARANQEFENLVSFNPVGADSIRVTALVQGQGFTLTESDLNLTESVVTANVAPISIPFGRAIVRRTTGANVTPRSAKLPDGSAQEFMGVLERIHSIVNVDNAGDTAPQGSAAPFADLTVVHDGQMLVEVDEAVTAGDPAFFRHAVGTGVAADIGKFRQDADTAAATAIVGAKFESTTTGAGLAAISLNGS